MARVVGNVEQCYNNENMYIFIEHERKRENHKHLAYISGCKSHECMFIHQLLFTITCESSHYQQLYLLARWLAAWLFRLVLERRKMIANVCQTNDDKRIFSIIFFLFVLNNWKQRLRRNIISSIHVINVCVLCIVCMCVPFVRINPLVLCYEITSNLFNSFVPLALSLSSPLFLSFIIVECGIHV